jgi:hypothetical protein
MAISLDALVIQIILGIIFLAPVLWIVGRLIAGKDKAKLTDAIWIVVLGTVIGGIFQYFFSGIIAGIIVLIIWLALVKHFFDTGWLRALAIAIIVAVVYIVVAILIVAILVLLGIAVAGTPFI